MSESPQGKLRVELQEVIETIAHHSEVAMLAFWDLDHQQLSYQIWQQKFVADIAALITKKYYPEAEEAKPVLVDINMSTFKDEETARKSVESSDIDAIKVEEKIDEIKNI